ncbi:MAG: immune inhibitor A [Anaerolineales bacterium]
MQERNWLPWAIGCIIALAICCLCLVTASFLGAVLYAATNSVDQGLPTTNPLDGQGWQSTLTPTPLVIQPTLQPGITPVPVSTETLHTLEQAVVPNNDPIDLARRLGGIPDVPLTVPPPDKPYAVGDQQTFWVSNVDTNENFQINATLQYITDHAYFWIEDSTAYRDRDLRNLADAFEHKIYPTDRAFFGSEWTPGVDGDPHIYIVYASGLGANLAGYFSSADELHPAAHKYSNAHEMFLFNADNVDLGEEFTYGVLAHEFQHMIHWYQDRNEASWLNEGFSELAAFLNGYDMGGFDRAYVNDPDIQLTNWPSDDTTPHYGASFLFLDYFLNRFGEQTTQKLVANPDNGMVSVDAILQEVGAQDVLTGQPVTADSFFRDWTLTNYLLNNKIYDGLFTYDNYSDAPQTRATERINKCPSGPLGRDVAQYGVDYIRITCRGDYTLHFIGNTRTGLLPADAHSGRYSFWSNQGDESDMRLTREFDFRHVQAPISLTYWTWYDLETDYDYLYLAASTDGETWQILKTPSGTDRNPSGNSYGWAYNDKSGGGGVWIQEQIDLSPFAGQQVYLRFEYVTDAAVNGEGFLLDDVSIPAIDYQTDFEQDDGGWQAEGFVRIENVLPQTFQVTLIIQHSANDITIQPLTLTDDHRIDVPISLSSNEQAVLVVSGTTRFTRQKAAYQVEISAP